MDNILVTIKWVLTAPSHFFSQIKTSQDMRDAGLYVIVLTFVSSFLNYVLTISSGWDLGLFRKFFLINLPLPGVGPMRLAMLGVVYSLVLVFFSYVTAGILQSWMRLFSGSASYNQSYQLIAYAMTPIYVFGWIAWQVSVICWVWVVGLLVVGSRNVFELSRRKAWLMFTLPVVLAAGFLAVTLLWFVRFLS